MEEIEDLGEQEIGEEEAEDVLWWNMMAMLCLSCSDKSSFL
jgi:hypothetical protein